MFGMREEEGRARSKAGAGFCLGPQEAMSCRQACDITLAHWSYIDSLARRRFPRDANLAMDGARYVLDRLEEDEFRRVRCWSGAGDFLPFLATMTARLLTDFYRSKFGHIRKPQWLEEKTDPIWHTAYRLAIVERWSRSETVQQLMVTKPSSNRWFIEEVVGTVIARCHERPSLMELQPDDEPDDVPDDSGPELPLDASEKEMLEAVLAFLKGDGAEPISPRVEEITRRMAEHLRLDDEDYLLLKLHYLEQLSMPTIKRRLQLEGDPYKRLKKLLGQLRKICQQIGFLSETE